MYKPDNEVGARRRADFEKIATIPQLISIDGQDNHSGVRPRSSAVAVPTVYRINDSLSMTSSIVALQCTEGQLCSVLLLVPHISSYEVLSCSDAEYKSFETALKFCKTHEDAVPSGSTLYKTPTHEIVYEMLQLAIAYELFQKVSVTTSPFMDRLKWWKSKYCNSNADATDDSISDYLFPGLNDKTKNNKRAVPMCIVSDDDAQQSAPPLPYYVEEYRASLKPNKIDEDTALVLAVKSVNGSTNIVTRQELYWTFVLHFPQGSLLSMDNLDAILFNSFHNYQLITVIPSASKTLCRFSEFCGLLQYSFLSSPTACADFVKKQHASHLVQKRKHFDDMILNSLLPPIEITGKDSDTLAFSEILQMPILEDSKERTVRWLSHSINVKRDVIDGQLYFIGVKHAVNAPLMNQDPAMFEYNSTSDFVNPLHMEEAMPSSFFAHCT
jgi:hypothetical protein